MRRRSAAGWVAIVLMFTACGSGTFADEAQESTTVATTPSTTTRPSSTTSVAQTTTTSQATTTTLPTGPPLTTTDPPMETGFSRAWDEPLDTVAALATVFESTPFCATGIDYSTVGSVGAPTIRVICRDIPGRRVSITSVARDADPGTKVHHMWLNSEDGTEHWFCAQAFAGEEARRCDTEILPRGEGFEPLLFGPHFDLVGTFTDDDPPGFAGTTPGVTSADAATIAGRSAHCFVFTSTPGELRECYDTELGVRLLTEYRTSGSWLPHWQITSLTGIDPAEFTPSGEYVPGAFFSEI